MQCSVFAFLSSSSYPTHFLFSSFRFVSFVFAALHFQRVRPTSFSMYVCVCVYVSAHVSVLCACDLCWSWNFGFAECRMYWFDSFSFFIFARYIFWFSVRCDRLVVDSLSSLNDEKIINFLCEQAQRIDSERRLNRKKYRKIIFLLCEPPAKPTNQNKKILIYWNWEIFPLILRADRSELHILREFIKKNISALFPPRASSHRSLFIFACLRNCEIACATCIQRV